MRGIKKENENARILKTLIRLYFQERYDDVRLRYITIDPSENVYIHQRFVPEAYIARWPSKTSV